MKLFEKLLCCGGILTANERAYVMDKVYEHLTIIISMIVMYMCANVLSVSSWTSEKSSQKLDK